MKGKILSILILSALLGSCAIIPGADVPEFDSLDEAWYWINNNIEYVRDIDSHGQNDYWQYPAETVELGTGDCEDICILFQDIAIRQFGIEVHAAWVEWDTPEGRACHMHPKINGKYFHDFFSWKNGFSEFMALDFAAVLSIIRYKR